jgi:hypothetical protein
MYDLLNCRHMELLCRQRAKADPAHSWKWLVRAERWENLGHRKTISSFKRNRSEEPDLGPNTIDGDQRLESLGAVS